MILLVLLAKDNPNSTIKQKNVSECYVTPSFVVHVSTVNYRILIKFVYWLKNQIEKSFKRSLLLVYKNKLRFCSVNQSSGALTFLAIE
ncbi:unnamed protein product [Schistosoma rodhaini]|uniref:Uncharacterized protein n=1 Tax=Schistosoma rodhaini TaxID=6188 RepID=A0AA85EJV4_9TREM|nr:unnamed protein product [Schistosoma rodhaini]